MRPVPVDVACLDPLPALRREDVQELLAAGAAGKGADDYGGVMDARLAGGLFVGEVAVAAATSSAGRVITRAAAPGVGQIGKTIAASSAGFLSLVPGLGGGPASLRVYNELDGILSVFSRMSTRLDARRLFGS
jgi:hypothetical protein